MAAQLINTAQLGFLSDPVGVSLYYQMGIDKDGLTIYQTIQGTNSVEGGVHMTIHHVFGSLQASPELAECILVNWILQRNCSVCLFLSVPNHLNCYSINTDWSSQPYWKKVSQSLWPLTKRWNHWTEWRGWYPDIVCPTSCSVNTHRHIRDIWHHSPLHWACWEVEDYSSTLPPCYRNATLQGCAHSHSDSS